MEQTEAPIDVYTCEDIRVLADDGTELLTGPKYLRCKRPECLLLVTRGMIKESGSCWCGNRRYGPALRLTKTEQTQLKQGYYPLAVWEAALIQPDVPDGQTVGWGKKEWEAAYA